MAVLVISYSRPDQPQVRGIVKLLRGAMQDIERAVYWDDDLEPGDDWFEQLKAAIDTAPKLFVMWCHHASQSAQVRREFQYALARQKRVVPVLLDSTPLAPELAAIHGIDLREAVIHAVAVADDPFHGVVAPIERGTRDAELAERSEWTIPRGYDRFNDVFGPIRPSREPHSRPGPVEVDPIREGHRESVIASFRREMADDMRGVWWGGNL